MRPVFLSHMPEVIHGLIFVIDSLDDLECSNTIDEACDGLRWLLESDVFCDVPLLVLANKQDDPRAKSPEVISSRITRYPGMDRVLCNRKWHLQATSGISADGLKEGLEWLVSQIPGQGVIL